MGLLAENPQRAKAELLRLDIQFTPSPVRDKGRSFLRAVATGNLTVFRGNTDLPDGETSGRRRSSPPKEDSAPRDPSGTCFYLEPFAPSMRTEKGADSAAVGYTHRHQRGSRCRIPARPPT